MNLQDLIQSCKTADRKAQKALFDRFSKTFLRLSFRYLNDRQYAEDAFALIFEKSHHRPTFQQVIKYLDNL